MFFPADLHQVIYGILYGNTFKIKDLATTEDGWQDLVFFCSCQDEDGIRRGFFQRFQERIKSGRAEHVYLIYDIDFVLTGLGSKTYLLHKGTDIIHRVVGCSIQLVNVKRTAFVKRGTGMAL